MNIHTVCFDLDRTLVDTEVIKKALHTLAKAYGIDEQKERDAIYRSLEKKGKMTFTLEAYERALEKIAKKQEKKGGKEVSKKIRAELEKKGERLILSGAKAMLNWCKKRNMAIVLLTLGVPRWQRQKLRWSKLDRYFDKKNMLFTDTRDTEKGKIALAKKYFQKNPDGFGIVWVNDRPEELEEFLKAFPGSIGLLRWEPKDTRVQKEHCKQLRKKFPTRVHWSDKLSSLLKKIDTRP